MKDYKKNGVRKTTLMVWILIFLVAGFGGAAGLGPVSIPNLQTRQALAATPGSFAELAKKASPSVVNISTVKVLKGGGQTPLPFGPNDQFRDFFDRYFKDQVPRDYKQQALGSGFVIDKEGYILTNNHVVEKSDEIKVKLADGKEYAAKVVGKDPKTDLALIKVDPDRALVPLPFGDSDKLEVGDWVVAIGNPFGLGNTVTAGIVSAKYRHIGAGSYDNFIQTDASINPGNSGGPLLNTAGEVIGVNAAIYSQSGGSVGIGFAIPVNMAKQLVPQLKAGKVVRGWLGVMIQKITPEIKEKLGLSDDKGALVTDVTAGGPANKAGIKRGDVIVSFDGREIKEMNDLPFVVASTPVEKTVTVEVLRKDRKESLQVKVGELKEEEKYQVASEGKPQLGMTLEEITPDSAKNYGLSVKSGIVVVQVEENSPAGEAGVRPGDVILEVDQIPVKGLQQFNQKLQTYKRGDTILLLIKRQKASLFVTLKVSE
jgi:serine protease Do